MVKSVLQTNSRFSLFEKGDSIVIALSGGADSVSLLHLLNSIKEEYKLDLYAAHLNHGIRGEEADRDEQFCKILCKKYNIPFICEHRDIPALAKERGIGEELCGREERYAFFESAAASRNAIIATAHTASDNAETLLHHLSRGMSLGGAAGIPPKRGNIIRPLIEQTREQIEAYCAEHDLEYVTDSTNLSDDYTRNRIRHNIIPQFHQLNPGFEKAALRFTQSAAAAKDFLDECACRALEKSRTPFGYDAEILKKNHEAVLYNALAMLCGGNAEQQHLRAIAEILPKNGAVSLNGGKTAVCRQGILRITEESLRKNFLEIPLCGAISFDFGDTIVNAFIDNSKLEIKPLFRTRQSGDSFTFYDRKITKPLRKMMNEKKIPSELRDRTLLLCTGSTVLWCMGVGYSAQGEQMRRENGLKIDTAEVPHA